MTHSSVDTATELHNICNLIEESDIDDSKCIQAISTRLYELIVSKYDEDSFGANMSDHIITSVKKKLLLLFHDHLRRNIVTDLSTWRDFITHSFSTFKTFFHQALGPFIMHTQDQFVSAYMKEDKHPFRLCVSLLQQLYESNAPIVNCSISVAVTRYVEASKDYLLFKTSIEVSTHYHQCRTLLKDWFRCSDTMRLGYQPMSFMNKKFVQHLPDAFGQGHVKCRGAFYDFFHSLYDLCHTHSTFFCESPTFENQKAIAVDICYHYKMYEHWSMLNMVLDDTTPPAQPENPCWFYWPEIQQAFRQQDETEGLKHFAEPLTSTLSGLCRFHLFNERSQQSLFSSYVLNGVKQQPNDIVVLQNYYDFIERMLQDPTDAFGSHLLLLVSKEIYGRYFDDGVATGVDSGESREHTYLLKLCTKARYNEKEWQWFIMLWTHLPNKDTFLHSYIESHLYPSIKTGKLSTGQEDTFFMLCMQKCKNECTVQLHVFRTLLHEWHHRSLDHNTFVVNRSLWPSSQPRATVKLHPLIQRLLHNKTDSYNKAFEHRSVSWCLHNTRATVTFAPNSEPNEPRATARIRANLFAINLLMWMQDSGRSCRVGDWVDKLFDTYNSINHLQEAYQHVNDFVKQRVITTSDVLAPHQTHDHNRTIRMSFVYDTTGKLRTLDALSCCVSPCETRDATSTAEPPDIVMVDRKSVMEATIVRVLKGQKNKMPVDELRDVIRQHIQSFRVEDELFQTTVRSLENREYLCYRDGQLCVEYLP